MCGECSEASINKTMDRGRFLKLGGAGLVGAIGAFGPHRLRAQTSSGASLAAEFRAAEEEYGVPEELLLAMGYVNTLWEMPPPEVSDYQEGDLHGRGAYGTMQLLQNPSRNTLGMAARLTGLSEGRLKTDRASNVRGGAAVLSDIAGKSKPSDINGWYDITAGYGSGPLYADEVYETLQRGASARISSGERLELPPQSQAEAPAIFTTLATADYWRAKWHGNNGKNYTNRDRGRDEIDKIVIHVAEGSYSGTLDWFRNPDCKNSSAHYTVSRRGAIGQSVREEDIAWHAGWWNTNKHSIGIEHAGYVDVRRSFTRYMYRASARLSARLSKKYRIPVDRRHIIGHNQVPGCDGGGGGVSCHTDPGRHWDWDRYIRLVKHFRRRS